MILDLGTASVSLLKNTFPRHWVESIWTLRHRLKCSCPPENGPSISGERSRWSRSCSLPSLSPRLLRPRFGSAAPLRAETPQQISKLKTRRQPRLMYSGMPLLPDPMFTSFWQTCINYVRDNKALPWSSCHSALKWTRYIFRDKPYLNCKNKCLK